MNPIDLSHTIEHGMKSRPAHSTLLGAPAHRTAEGTLILNRTNQSSQRYEASVL